MSVSAALLCFFHGFVWLGCHRLASCILSVSRLVGFFASNSFIMPLCHYAIMQFVSCFCFSFEFFFLIAMCICAFLTNNNNKQTYNLASSSHLLCSAPVSRAVLLSCNSSSIIPSSFVVRDLLVMRSLWWLVVFVNTISMTYSYFVVKWWWAKFSVTFQSSNLSISFLQNYYLPPLLVAN